MSQHDDELSNVRSHLRRWSEGDVDVALSQFRRRRELEARLGDMLTELRQSLRRWSPERVEEALRSVRFRRDERQRASRRLVFVGVAVAAAAAIVLAIWSGALSPAPNLARDRSAPPAVSGATAPHLVASVSEPNGARHLALDDGSDVMLPDRTSQARVTEDGNTQVVVVLDSGRANFRVKHRAARRFVVQVGGVQIEDLGTVFDVERGTLEVSIQVLEGRVRVLWQGRAAELAAGERGTYPIGETTPESAPAGKLVSAPSAEAKPAVPEASWRLAAREGRYKDAFQLLEGERFVSVRDEPSDLLLAADVARLSGHAARAVEPLRSLLLRHRADPRSPAAAFTLGSVLLRDLNRPREAARAFDDAQRLAPSGNLAEDAAARAAEAWFKAGEGARARAALDRYEARYPRGRHLAFLKRLIQSRD